MKPNNFNKLGISITSKQLPNCRFKVEHIGGLIFKVNYYKDCNKLGRRKVELLEDKIKKFLFRYFRNHNNIRGEFYE